MVNFIVAFIGTIVGYVLGNIIYDYFEKNNSKF